MLRLPSFFPNSPTECRTFSEPFFECFTKNSNKESDLDTESGNRGLSKCTKELKLYEECMTKLEKKKPQLRLRVTI